MISYKVPINEKRRHSSRFITRTNIFLIKKIKEKLSFMEENQKFLSEKTGIDESTISRIMKGEGNLTLRTIGELSWAVGLSFDIKLSEENRPAKNIKLNEAKSIIYNLSNNLLYNEKLYVISPSLDVFKIEKNLITTEISKEKTNNLLQNEISSLDISITSNNIKTVSNNDEIGDF